MRGFTLIEMLIVVALIGLILGMIGWRSPERSRRLDDEAAIEAIVTAARAARTQAIVEHRPVTLDFDAGARSWRDGGGMAHELPAGLDLVQPGPRAIRFEPDGSAGGGVALHRGAVATRIAVNPLTGAAMVSNGG